MNVYFISGLAADSRVFKHIKLPPGYEMLHLNWIQPVKRESLSSYSLRLAEAINLNEPFVIVGLSLGGMIATEIAKVYKPVTTILFSSVPTHKHLPPLFKISGLLGVHQIIPVALLKKASKYKRDFCPDTEEDKKILRQVIQDSDPAFIRWAIGAILSWRNEVLPNPLWHIHGLNDEILPVRYTKPTHKIPKANHLMVMSEAPRLNEFLKEVLAAL